MTRAPGGEGEGTGGREIYWAIYSSIRRCFGKRYGSGDADADATCRRYTTARRYRCRAITPLLRGTPCRRATLDERLRLAYFVNFAYQSSERERERESVTEGGGGGGEGEERSRNARCGTRDDKGHRCMKAEKAMSRSSQINAAAHRQRSSLTLSLLIF